MGEVEGGQLREVSVVIRSYNRLPELVDLLNACLEQRGVSFEIVVVEQTTNAGTVERKAFETLAASDPRVRVLRRPPLGGAGARNEGVRAARAHIIVLIDDDDLPARDDWLACHVANFQDPDCLGVTGRQVEKLGENPPYTRPGRSYRRFLTYSRWLRLPIVQARQNRRKVGTQVLHGTNSSIRRDALVRFGLWDETVRLDDEASFCYRLARGKRPDEYLVFDPTPVVIRRKGVAGGLAKRHLQTDQYMTEMLVFMHRVVGRYHTMRFVGLYVFYILAAVGRTAKWSRSESDTHESKRGWPRALLGALLVAPRSWLRAVGRTIRTAPPPVPTL